MLIVSRAFALNQPVSWTPLKTICTESTTVEEEEKEAKTRLTWEVGVAKWDWAFFGAPARTVGENGSAVGERADHRSQQRPGPGDGGPDGEGKCSAKEADRLLQRPRWTQVWGESRAPVRGSSQPSVVSAVLLCVSRPCRLWPSNILIPSLLCGWVRVNCCHVHTHTHIWMTHPPTSPHPRDHECCTLWLAWMTVALFLFGNLPVRYLWPLQHTSVHAAGRRSGWGRGA